MSWFFSKNIWCPACVSQFCFQTYQCINCLFPTLRAYDTVLRLEAPGTGCQGINIGDIQYSVVLLLEGASIYMGDNSSLSSFSSPSWISILSIVLHLACFLFHCLLFLSPSLYHVFTLFPSSSFPASFLPNFQNDPKSKGYLPKTSARANKAP